MRRLIRYFMRGLIVTAPVALTLYVCWAVFERLDRWLRLPVPGAGFVLTLLLITLIGFLASNLLGRGIVSALERMLTRLPFVRLLYSSTKDLLNAFVGEHRRFDRPVVVSLPAGGNARAIGFVTADALDHLGLAGWVAVYLPQSYNFAGNLLLFPADQVHPLAAPSSEVLAFVVSGGISRGVR